LPAFVLAVASLVRLPSLVANITSACITRQVCHSLAHVLFLSTIGRAIAMTPAMRRYRRLNPSLALESSTSLSPLQQISSGFHRSHLHFSHDSMWLLHLPRPMQAEDCGYKGQQCGTYTGAVAAHCRQ
jgi:hypothetical protein